jgi:hypothetical protein
LASALRPVVGPPGDGRMSNIVIYLSCTYNRKKKEHE